MGNQIPARPVTEQSSVQEQDLGFKFRDESVHKDYVYCQADGAITSGDYVDADPSNSQAKKCWGNKHQTGILTVAKVTYTDNYYGFFEVVKKGIYEGFDKCGISYGIAVTGEPTGTAGDENFILTGNGNLFEYHIIGTQTIIRPIWVKGASGYMNLMLDDAAADDGHELTNGTLASDKLAFIVGQDAAFHARMKVTIEDISGTDDFVFGFRKAEAYQTANVDDYDEMAALQLIDTVQNTHTILNGGTTTVTDTTDASAGDTVAFTWEVRVSAAGVVTYLIDGSAPTVATAFTFDDGEIVVPFIFAKQHTDLHGYIHYGEWEVGLD